jgi:hypothetical protein
MERELWPELYQLVRKTGRQVHQKGVRYQPWAIALLVLWAALHDRPRSWACERKNWSTTRLQPLQLPSASVLTRRADSVGMGLFWRMLEQALRNSEYHGLLSIVDGKPLFVGGCTKDPDARFGFGAGIRGKGYKLHTIWANRCLPEAWEITPLNQHESIVARELVAQVDGGGYLLGDGNYDETPLHDMAGQRGYQLLTNDRRPNAGKGHRPVGAFRRRSIELRHTTFGQRLLAQRSTIERRFGHATIFAGGLGPLPAWVRRRTRVRTWVWVKLLINAARLKVHSRLAA